eukprot:Plantae.Rhodophyta-Hildenbrandia_rubra.ctg10136.p1 GENE.Plantae.Rhodophyta-Hildenbrandia_rubra.ctg10136~~Plantae.Rhodophyta-Hildenbrandia_rubra.ctg10136.p1  ORF type:complete len:597 (+),score=95.59 Plantae.Rhodophyta-Hildenbrandia_rubra.ctg10136:274-2064(+)
MVDAQATNGDTGVITRSSFRVRIWDVHGTLNTPERPVVVKFNIDAGKYKAVSNVVRDTRTPQWLFPAQSSNSNDGVGSDEPLRKDIKFLYHTKTPERLPQKLVVVTLCERNKRGAETEWGRAAIPLNVIARGCQRIKLSMMGEGNTNYGMIEFRCAMTEIRKVEVELRGLRIVEYPERHRHELKMIYFEFGYLQFGDGYKIGTEKSSEGDPVFRQLPVLSASCSLAEMIDGNQNGSQWQVFFSLHRQVSRERTEEIGIGALPIKLIFQKKRGAPMDTPAKFKVPLADGKGTIKGKVILRNLPQYAQLRGDDIYYEDGFFMPGNIDLSSRLLLPWLSLPKQAKQQMSLHKNSGPPSPVPASPSTLTSSPAASQPLPNGVYPHVNGQYSPTNSSSPDSSLGQLLPVNRAAYAAGNYQYAPSREGHPNFAYVPQNVYDSPPRGQSPGNGWAPPPYAGASTAPSPRSVGSTVPPLDNAMMSYLPPTSVSDAGSARTSADGGPGVSNSSYPYSSSGGDVSPAGPLDRRQDVWLPVRLANSERFYFANQRTKESLWLPPRWERREDDLGRQFFVDHNTQTTQFQFPAVEARMYREHAKTNRT